MSIKCRLSRFMIKEDTRLDATFFQYMFEGKTRGACWKKTDGTYGWRELIIMIQMCLYIYRYADVLLMLAECEKKTGWEPG